MEKMISMNKKIMVVDNNPDIAFIIKLGLEDLGVKYDIIDVESGEKCIEFLKNKQIPDLILLDIMLPDMNGWEIFDILKENLSWEKIPIIFISAKTDKITKNAGEFLGNEFIEKPFDILDLKMRIDKILNTDKIG